MSKTNTIFKSFIVVPMIATSLSVNTMTTSMSSLVSQITGAPVQDVSTTQTPEQKLREEHAAKIDAYFAQYDMPLAGYGMKMVLEAEKHDVDWRMIPAIAVRESTGGIHACKSVKFSPFGFGSCRISFKSYDDAIEVIAKNLGGNNPNTAAYYDGKTNRQILQSYNPPSVIPKYADEVMSIMNKIDDMDA
ncbi:MAG: hypothetical protein WCQ32_01310 [bacterium]